MKAWATKDTDGAVGLWINERPRDMNWGCIRTYCANDNSTLAWSSSDEEAGVGCIIPQHIWSELPPGEMRELDISVVVLDEEE